MEIKLSNEEYGFQKILDDFDKTKTINIVTYNISANSNELLNFLKTLKNKEIKIVTNIPNRYNTYYKESFKKKASGTIKQYLKNLEPNSFLSSVEIYFNFNNHSKIYSTDKYTYIGSQNFSDESKKNYEIGIIIDNSIKNENLGENIIENFIYEYNNTVRFLGIDVEKMKSNFKIEMQKIEKILRNFKTEIDIHYEGYDYLIEVKNKFQELKKIISEVQIIIEEMEEKLKKIKEKNNLYDIEFIKKIEKKFEKMLEGISELDWKISPQGDFSEVYYDPIHEINENTYDADEEHLEEAIERESITVYDYCDDIKNNYYEELDNFFRSFNEDIFCLKKLFETIEEITSNRELIDNTSN
ncbi:hypothetical protein [Fusobacterium ulcerans]|uniref:hypothetical protein n=1 Tax=Fusobacterium ulcerans TaxID=861 RepID=UPI0026F08059|nr:hypothetical protein [Fusobacterium ulcerans]